MTDDIYKRIKRKGINAFVHNIKHNLVYHYTSMGAFYNIFRNKEFWIGNSLEMNDREELIGFTKTLKQELTKNKNVLNSDRFELFFKNLEKRIEVESPYILCFSSLMDDAAQWERYSNDATGVCLEINTKVLAKACYDNFFVSTNVSYNYDIKENKYFNLLRKYFLSGKIRGFRDEKDFIDNLIVGAAAYKHASFKSESEYRVYNIWGKTPKYSKEEFRLINGRIRKMLIIDIDKLLAESEIDTNVLINKIIVGPCSKQSVEELKSFVKDCGLIKLSQNIYKSSCPLRG